MHQPEDLRPETLYRYRFGTAEFDEAAFTLRVDAVPIEIQRRPLEILALLLRRVDEVVTREEFLESLWAGAYAAENVLATAMTKLRIALGPDNAGRIVTQSRVGYRLIGPVERIAVGMGKSGAPRLEAGSPVRGREHFVLDKVVGRSHGSEVWLAHHVKSREIRVYKFSPDGVALSALKREVTLARLLRDALGPRDDFVRVIDWNFDTPPFFLEFEYGGQNLREWADSHLGAMPFNERLALFLQIADAVAAAHSVGVLHKDIKPGNVLIAPRQHGWQARLTDFGSGRLLEAGRLEALSITPLGLNITENDAGDGVGGTPLYLAPEVIAGQSPTVKSDLYALGLILHQITKGDFDKTLVPGWERDIAAPFLRADIAAATDGDPALRLDSVAELARRLRTLDDRRRDSEREMAAAETARQAAEALKRSRARRPWVLATIATLGAGLAATLILYLQVRDSEKSLATELNIAQTLQHFLTDDLIGAAKFSNSGRSDMTVAAAIKAAADKIDETFRADPPAVRTALHIEMERSFYELRLCQESNALSFRLGAIV